jgi:MoaD family protein
LREITGKRDETLSFPEGVEITLNKVVRTLAEKYGRTFTDYVYDQKTGEIRGFLQFLVNGKNTTEGLSTLLRDGDVLAILPPVGGG